MIAASAQIRNSLWTRIQNSAGIAFTAFASDLEANHNIRPKNLCPNCECNFGLKDLKDTARSPEGETQAWIFEHRTCGAKLEVFND